MYSTLPPSEAQRIPTQFDPDHLDQDALKVIRRLVQHGHEAYLVGGCVRDLLLGERPKDFDVATSAKPNEIRKLFRNCRIIGRRFRLAHIFFANQKIIEVATFRAAASLEAEPPVPPADQTQEAASESSEASEDSGSSEKGSDLLIRDDNVFGTAESDAIRRDFTLNALFYDVENSEVIDFVGGMRHLMERTLVSIGDPWVRLREDPVRMIRAAKFASRLSLTLDPKLESAITDCAEEIAKSSPARVTEEIFKVLSSAGLAGTFESLRRFGILRLVLPFLEEEYSRRSPEERKQFWRYLETLECAVRNRLSQDLPLPPAPIQRPTRAMLFAALICPCIEREVFEMMEHGFSGELRARIPERIQALALAMRNPRKDTYRVIQMLQAFDRLRRGAHLPQSEAARRSRRRALPARKFAGRPYFSEGLQFLWIFAAAHSMPRLWEAYGSWEEWRDQEPGASEAPPRERGPRRQGGSSTNGQSGSEAESSPQGPPRRRRRRGGRRRRSWKGGSTPTEQES